MSRAQDLDYQPRPKVIESPERNGEGFDLRVLIKDGLTGEVIRHQPYALHCIGRHKYFERPMGSGNLFYGDGKVAGRLVRNPDAEPGTPDEYYADTKAPHIEAVLGQEPMSPDTVRDENETLRRELAALQAQVDALTAPETESRRQR